MKTLRIAFDDFWGGFNPEVNYFTSLLRTKHQVIIDQENPDLAFYSVFGQDNLRRSCCKVFFTGENQPPRDDLHTELNFTFSTTGDYNNYRLPLWVLYIDWFKTSGPQNPEYTIPINHLFYKKEEKDWPLFLERHNKLSAFCGNFAGPRKYLLPRLVDLDMVASFGAFSNNTDGKLGGNEYDKIMEMGEYRFSLCVENSVADGYVTEKLLHGLYAHSIPFYIGDTQALLDFNLDAFVFLDENIENSIHTITEYLSADPETLKDQFMQPIFRNNKIADDLMPDAVLAKIEEIL